MTLKHVIENFLKNQDENKKSVTAVTYKKKIYIFYEYLETVLLAKDVNYIGILMQMTLERLMDSVRYYVETCNVKYMATADTYITVLKLFFDFISEEYGWSNKYFESNYLNKELKNAYENKTKELHLCTAKQVEPIKEDKILELLQICDCKIDNVNIERAVSGKNNGEYSGYISSLIVKLMVIYGCKNASINDLIDDDYNNDLNKIRINGFSVRLPDKLAMQMKKYWDLRKKLLRDIKTKRLFVDPINPSKKIDNTKMFHVLKEVLGSNQATSVAKYSIIQMIKKDVPAHIIKKFTGYSDGVFEYCQSWVDEEKGTLMISEKSKLIDAAIRQNDLFDNM